MFSAEVHFPESDDLTVKMAVVRDWLDHRRFEPSTFRYAFTSPGIVFRVDFTVEAPAVAFAREFGGRVIGARADVLPQAAAD